MRVAELHDARRRPPEVEGASRVAAAGAIGEAEVRGRRGRTVALRQDVLGQRQLDGAILRVAHGIGARARGGLHVAARIAAGPRSRTGAAEPRHFAGGALVPHDRIRPVLVATRREGRHLGCSPGGHLVGVEDLEDPRCAPHGGERGLERDPRSLDPAFPGVRVAVPHDRVEDVGDGGAGSAARAVAVRVAHRAPQGAGGALLRGQPGRVAALACTGGAMDLDVPGLARIHADRDRSARRSTRAPETLPVPLALADRVASGTDQHAIAGGDGAGVERQHELAPGAPRRGGTSTARVVARLAVDDPGVARPDRAVARAGRRGFGRRRTRHRRTPAGAGRSRPGRWRRSRSLARAVAAHRRRRAAVGRAGGRALRRLAHAVAAHRRRRRPDRALRGTRAGRHVVGDST